SDEVSWFAMRMLRIFEEPSVTRALREMDLTDQRPQVLSLAAIAILPKDHARAMTLLRRAIVESGDDDAGEDSRLEFAYRLLVFDAIESGGPAEAVQLLRQRARRQAEQGDATSAVFGLMALHADRAALQRVFHGVSFRPIEKQLERDLEEFAAYLGQPEVMYAL